MRRVGITYERAIDRVCNLPKDRIDQYAAAAARALGFSPGGDVWALIQRLGGRLHVQDVFSDSADDDTIVVHGKGDFDIIVSSISSPRRDRFTIAHELGHYLLHSWQGKYPLVAARSGSDRAEWEANWFAAGFLMPAEVFKRAFDSGKAVSALAGEFAVSEAAAEVRTKALGLTRG